MGVLDLLDPLYQATDRYLAMVVAADGIRLVFWGATAGGLAMITYARISPQTLLDDLALKIKHLNSQLMRYDGDDFGVVCKLSMENLSLNLKRLWLTLLPALMASLPAITIFTWAEANFAYRGSLQATPITTVPAASSLALKRISPREFRLEHGEESMTISPRAAEITTRHWWHALSGNPIGYLPADWKVQTVSLPWQARTYVPLGPDWLRGWQALFFGAAGLVAVSLKFGLKVS